MEAAGVYDDTVRVSVGIEDTEDLINDFTNAVVNTAGEGDAYENRCRG